MAQTQEYVPDLAKLRKKRHEGISNLRKLQLAADRGEVVNICPYGCSDDEVDDHGYCRHLVGFTNSSPAECAAGKGSYEPMVLQGEHRIVKPERPEIKLPGSKRVSYGPAKLPAVEKTDKLVRISVSYRVYRDIDAKGK